MSDLWHIQRPNLFGSCQNSRKGEKLLLSVIQRSKVKDFRERKRAEKEVEGMALLWNGFAILTVEVSGRCLTTLIGV